MLKWAAASGLVPLNPLAGVPKPAQKRGKGRLVRPFTDAEALLILADARSRQGAARWLPWVQAFSGARISEVAQASAADVREVDGIPCLVVTDIGEDGELIEGKSVKSEAGLRTIPLHPKVIAEGFLEYAQSIPEDGPLFPDLRLDKYGRRGPPASGMIADIVRGLGITDKKVATSHSWRHRVKDALRNARVPGDVQDALLGHEAGGNAGRFYGLGFSVAVLAEAVAKIPAPAGLNSPSGGVSGAD
jgi:integrase